MNQKERVKILADIIDCNTHFDAYQILAITSILNAQESEVKYNYFNARHKSDGTTELYMDGVLERKIGAGIPWGVQHWMVDYGKSPIAFAKPEVHGWNRCLSQKEIDERCELQKQGQVSVATCDCDICKRERREIAKLELMKFSEEKSGDLDTEELMTLNWVAMWLNEEPV